MNEFYETNGNFKIILDKYDGITIDENFEFESAQSFDEELSSLTQYLTRLDRKLLWIYIQIEKSELIPVCAKQGFHFHTCNDKRVLMVKRLEFDAIIPTASNHTLGVGVVVINEKSELLVIKEKHSSVGFKLPGGHVDDAELIQSAVKREVFEETGIHVEFESIISLGHFYPHQFDKSNLYVLCKAKPLNYQINIQDTQEVLEAKWIDVNEYINNKEGFEYNQKIVKTALLNQGLHTEDIASFKKIPKKYELFF